MRYELLPPSALVPFARFNSIDINGVEAGYIGGEPVDAGIGLKFSSSVSPHDPSRPLVTIGRDLILCAETVWEHAKADAHLAEALAAAGGFARTPRGAVMVFLIVCMSAAAGFGVGQGGGAWSGYVKFLPKVPIPTTWTDDERRLLRGTSLNAAVTAKLQTLEREFDHFRDATSGIKWCREAWWGESRLTLMDWKTADSWFRSRALELPTLGPGMVPVLDFANHSLQANARYSVCGDSDVLLLLQEGEEGTFEDGREITINYGSERSAAEMVFSYGFVDETMDTALSLALDLQGLLLDDPASFVKQAALKSAPRLHIYDLGHTVEWTSDFVWLLCPDEEDGLSLKFLQETSGEQHLEVLWNDDEVDDITKLVEHLQESNLWPVFQLRATALVQGCVATQLAELLESEEEETTPIADKDIRYQELFVATRLRTLERRLLEKAVVVFEAKKNELLGSEVVREYSMRAQASAESEEGADEALGEEGDLS